MMTTTDHDLTDLATDQPRLHRLLTTPTVFDDAAWDEFYRRTIPTPPHVYRRRRLGVILAAAILALIGTAIHEGIITDEAPPATSPDLLSDQPVCQEDMACWDCATMGNRICGPVTTTEKEVT
jgi:hypothetical protein